MKKNKNLNSWFTLIEVLVAVTIFSIMMTFVMMIYASSTQLSSRVEINRQVQQNIKNIVEVIAEDVRENWISWVSKLKGDRCDLVNIWNKLYKNWTELCTNYWNNKYYLAKCDEKNENCIRVENINTDCVDKILSDWTRKINNCTFIKNNKPLSNSLIKITDLKFLVSWITNNDKQKKVTIKFSIMPRLKKGVWLNLVKNATINFQTTINEKLIKSN